MSSKVHDKRNRSIPNEGVGGFSQCWYPVALSNAIGKGQLLGCEFLDGRVVVYRGDDGQVRVQSAYCRHLGADLSIGEVRGNDLVCAFHHWQYGPDGMCTKIPASAATIPRRAKLFSYPTAEALGLVWAFNGVEPLYEVPSFPAQSADTLVVRATEGRSWRVPPYLLLTNSVDFQHLRELHGMSIELDPADIVIDSFGYEFEIDGSVPQFGDLHQHIKCFGNNTITLKMSNGEGVEILALFAATPTPTGCLSFNVAAALRGDGRGDDDARAERDLSLSEMMMTQLLDEDAPVMDTIRFREDTLIDADSALSKFFRYVREYPRQHPGDGLIN